jgi:putative ABC transport system ATP-binding protein
MLLKVCNIEKSYVKGKKVLQGLNFEIDENEFVGILGVSGCGKTTFLKTISGMDKPDSGQILYKGREIARLPHGERDLFRKMEVGMIFQDFQLIECLTVAENIALSLEINGMEKGEAKEQVLDLLEMYGMKELADKFPEEISGGEKQRTAIARACIKQPSIILADEPTGNLDRQRAKMILETFEEISREHSVLMVTHDLYAASFCSRIVRMKQGIIEEEIKRCGSRREFFLQLLNFYEDEEGF